MLLEFTDELDKLTLAEDDWISSSKKRWRKSAESNTKVEGHIESISKGSALLIPTVDDANNDGWKESSEEEQDSDASVQEVVDKSTKGLFNFILFFFFFK